MPTYTYKCDSCGHKAEEFHAAGERLSLDCVKCGTAPMTWQFPCPNLHTDTTFLANRDDGFGSDSASRKLAKAKAKAAGVSTSGMVYCPSLCPPGESLSPKAWIGGKADIKRICRKNNWSSADLGIKADKIDAEPKPYRVADDLVNNEVERIVDRQGGGASPKERTKLSREARERLAGVN